MKQVHDLKVHPSFFEQIRLGSKRCEWRAEHDRHFEEWDHLILREWDPRAPWDGEKKVWLYAGEYTGRTLCAVVTHILRGSPGDPVLGSIPGGYALLSIRLLHDHADDQKGLYFQPYLDAHLPNAEITKRNRP